LHTNSAYLPFQGEERRIWYMVQLIAGYILILLGVVMEVIALLVWLGVIKPPAAGMLMDAAGPWDFLIALLGKAPWCAVVGLLLIYGGLKCVGVALPF
jgi:hypothetical protein